MTFQQYIQQKNLDISIINFEDLEEFNRLDSEYYLPIYLKIKRYWLKLMQIWDILEKSEYWLSIEMNEDWIWEKIFRMNDLKDWIADNDDLKFANIDNKTFKKYKVNRNDVLFNRVNSIDFVWRTWIFKSNNEDSVFASYLIRLVPNSNIVKPDYLNIFLNSKYWRLEILRKARRAVNQANVNAEELKRINLPIPSKDFQSKIENLSEESYKQKELSKSLYLEAEKLLLSELWFETYIPTEENISIKDSEEVDIFWRFDAEFFQPKYDEIIDKIKSYKWWYDILENLITISNEKIKKEQDKTFKYIELADINASLWIVNAENEILSQDLPSRAQMKIKTWDVLVSSVAGSADKVAIIINEDKNLVASTWFFVLRPKFFNPEANLILMKSWIYKDMLIRSARWMILEATNKEDFSKFILPKLDIKIQENIAELVKKSHIALDLSKELLEKAKKSVEIFIEEDEEKAEKFIEN